MAFYRCFEERRGQFGILVPVGKAQNSVECRLIKLSAGYCRPAPTSIVTTLDVLNIKLHVHFNGSLISLSQKPSILPSQI